MGWVSGGNPLEELDVVREIAPGDEMHRAGHEEQYFLAGQSALRCIASAMEAAGIEARSGWPGKVLDLPCGHGRIMRAMKVAFPNAGFTACDINLDGVDFCARTFGARPVHSKFRGEELDLEDRFDLIWCGSLLTHLDNDRWPGFLDFFERSLAADGLLVFTVFGPEAARRLRTRENEYELTPEKAAAILRDYDRDGFGYTDYPGQQDSGMSLASPDWVREQIRARTALRLVSHSEQAWHTGRNSHQDVVACLRAAD
jgi:SAM-dependent methyltransferase